MSSRGDGAVCWMQPCFFSFLRPQRSKKESRPLLFLKQEPRKGPVESRLIMYKMGWGLSLS
jgi:hypothetical protein